MSRKLLYCLVTLSLCHWSRSQSAEENEIKVDETNPYAEAANEILKGQNLDNLGGMIGDFMQAGGHKQLGDMLMSQLGNNKDFSGQILQGLGSMLNQKEGGIDPSVLGDVLSSLASGTGDGKAPIDLGAVLGALQNGGFSASDLLSYAPMVVQTLESFVGSDATKREQEHAGHAWMLPPVLEKLHVLLDHFLHSDAGRTMITNLGAEKFVKIFRDEKGRMSYRKFVDMLENQSFRRHWIHMITSRLLDYIAYFADPYTQKKYMATMQFFVNNFLKSQGFPKGALFDPARPTESINSFLNHISKRLINSKFNFKPYVKPIVEYFQEVLRLAEEKGILGRGINSQALSHKLTDTINLEIIEPIARVNRAYRFALKVPKCDRYVMCLINQEGPDEQHRLPALKKLLNRGASIFASWFLSGHTGTSFLRLYSLITDEEEDCQAKFHEECNDFHIEEIKVTTEYVHNEL